MTPFSLWRYFYLAILVTETRLLKVYIHEMKFTTVHFILINIFKTRRKMAILDLSPARTFFFCFCFVLNDSNKTYYLLIISAYSISSTIITTTRIGGEKISKIQKVFLQVALTDKISSKIETLY